MSSIPKPDKKPKYNKNDAFVWVDSQWEKFMTEQKEHKAMIKQLQEDLATCTENFQIQRKQMEELVGRVPSNYLVDKENKGTYIYESPDGGETVYRREFGNYENKEVVEDNFDINEIKEKAPIIGEIMEHVNKPSPSEEDILKQKVLNLEMANAELKDILRNMGVSI